MKVINEILDSGIVPVADERAELTPTVTLSEAADIVRAFGSEQSVLLLSPPGVGKSAIVRAVAQEAGLRCESLLGTQIAPEDVSGIPRIVGERSVFCPPRVLLPEDDEPFCLFLDELPAASPDVQKALYALLLERRLGEHRLPEGSWVVAAGNRMEDAPTGESRRSFACRAPRS
jgi:MoxR-like ATPase